MKVRKRIKREKKSVEVRIYDKLSELHSNGRAVALAYKQRIFNAEMRTINNQY